MCFQNEKHILQSCCTYFTVKLAQVSMTWSLISSLSAQTDRYDKATGTRKYQKNTADVSKSVRLASDVCCGNNYQLKWRWRRSWDQKDTCPFLSQTCVIPGETGDPWKKTKNTIMFIRTVVRIAYLNILTLIIYKTGTVNRALDSNIKLFRN